MKEMKGLRFFEDWDTLGCSVTMMLEVMVVRE